MSELKATIDWKCDSPDFMRGKYSREHTWTFDGGLTVAASSSPGVVPVPYSNPANIDPEEALLAAVASCHMLSFLHVARKEGFQVDAYRDAATGTMAKNERGVLWVNAITLTPQITFGGEKQPTPAELEHLHHLAHEQCFIANSVKSEITVETS